MFLPILLISGFISAVNASGLPSGAVVSESVKVPLGFSVLRDSDTCRASRMLPKEVMDGAQICFSSQAWNTWLRLSVNENDLNQLKLFGKWELRVFNQGEQRVFKVHYLNPIKGASDSAVKKRQRPLWEIAQQIVQWIERERMRISDAYANSDSLGIFRRLILDERPSSELVEQHELMRELGFVHLLTPSGLHLYALARWVFFFTQALAFFLGFHFTSARRVSSVITLSAVGWSWALTGFRWGLLRPLMMITVSKSAEILGFNFRRGSSLFLAVIVDCLFELILTWNGAFASFAQGRLHYILAVAGGLLAMENNEHALSSKKFLPEFQLHVRLALGSWFTTAVYDSFMHSGISLATPILSLITVPVLAGWVYPVLCVSTFSEWALQANEAGVHALSTAIEFTTHFIFENNFYYWVPRWALATGAFVSLSFFFLNRQNSLRILFISAALLIRSSVVTFASPIGQRLYARSVEQLDVGQGDAALVTMNERSGTYDFHYGFVDTGSIRAKSFVSWLHFFSERGILNLDFIALTHLDEDHSGAVMKIADLLPIACVVTSERQWGTTRGQHSGQTLKEKKVKPVSWNSGCFPFSYSAPEERKQGISRRPRSNTDMSAVLIPIRSEHGSYDYVSLGDADAKDEIKMLPWLLNLRADTQSFQRSHIPLVFKVSHHGSITSTSGKLLQALRPDEAWLSFGANNRYGHPALQTLEKLESLGIRVQTTVGKSLKR